MRCQKDGEAEPDEFLVVCLRLDRSGHVLGPGAVSVAVCHHRLGTAPMFTNAGLLQLAAPQGSKHLPTKLQHIRGGTNFSEFESGLRSCKGRAEESAELNLVLKIAV